MVGGGWREGVHFSVSTPLMTVFTVVIKVCRSCRRTNRQKQVPGVCVCVCKAGGGLSGRGQNDVLSQGGAGEGPMTWVPDTLPGMLRLVVVRSR